ncbi:MAG TPA: hypothetical protein VKU44_05805 [Terriglobia bacterium]|nr:hypothetical protein [Terriglobia bacterium]
MAKVSDLGLLGPEPPAAMPRRSLASTTWCSAPPASGSRFTREGTGDATEIRPRESAGRPASAPLFAGVSWLWGLLARFEAKEEGVATQHQMSHPDATIADDLRARNARALELVREWLADESGYDEKVFPVSQGGAGG